MTLSNSEKKPLKRIAHHLDAVVQIGDQGLTGGVTAETQRALADHELIKVRIPDGEKATRNEMADALAQACDATIVQRIGKVVILFKPNPKADPRLSNLHRYSGGA